MRCCRVLVKDIAAVVALLRAVNVVKSNGVYATIEADSDMLRKLTDAGIFWTED